MDFCGQCGIPATACYTAQTVLIAATEQPERTRPGDGVSTVTVLTAVLWLGCLGVGAVGFVLPYARPHPPAPAAPAVQAELIKVELNQSPAPAPTPVQPPPDPTEPPPLFTPATPPQAPQLVAVALPSPAVAFALPVVAPARIVEVKQAAFVRTAPQPAPVVPSKAPGVGAAKPAAIPAPAPAVQTLTFGDGEGNQPAPRYPDSARRAGQEGTVVVRFSVGADGRVLAAEPSSPSPWGALNREALRVVREQWRFKPGPVRLYEVAIRFELRK
ncbi:MAG: TonB family protein [Limisphaerales bacterium]|nr:MAG: TonB family protein [Limisphaerales bacterium]KAG0508227.1 MAG: TonB family protein [Limisphaerales bacterium]TXT51676.1 MAG: TonB family protein [Limisphaerales bacterium]